MTVAAWFAEALTREGGQDEARLLLDTWTPGPGTPADAVAAHRLAHSVLHFVEGRHAEAVESAAGEDPATEALALAILRENTRSMRRLSDAVSHGERATRLAGRVGSPETGAFERTDPAEPYPLLGRGAEAEELAVAAEKTAREHAPRPLPYALTALARTHMVRDPAEARALLARGEERAERLGEQQALYEARLASAGLALRDGHPDAALDLLDRIAATPRAACPRGGRR